MAEVDPSQAINILQRVVRGSFDDCSRALRNEDYARAKRELDQAVTEIKRAISRLR